MQKLSVELFDIDGYFEPITIYNNILSVSFGALDRGDLSNTVQWGIYSNTGEIKLIDIDGSVTNLLKSKNKIKARIYASSDRFDTLLATFIVDDFVANAETKEISIQLKDSLVDWQDINVYRKYLFYSTDLYDILDDILYNTGVSIRYEKSDYTEGFFEDIEIYCPYLESSSLWNMVTKVCEVAMCRVYEDEYGNPTITYVGSTMIESKILKPIVIRSRNIIEIPNNIKNSKTAIPVASIAAKSREKIQGTVATTTIDMYGTGDNPRFDRELYPYRYLGDDDTYNKDTILKRVQRDTQSDGLVFDIRIIKNIYPDVDINSIFELFSLNFNLANSYPNEKVFTGIYWRGLGGVSAIPNKKYESADDHSFISLKQSQIVLDVAVLNVADGDTESFSYPAYVTEKLAVAVKGRYFEDNNDITEQYGNGKPIELPANDLLQTKSKNKSSGKSHAQEILDTVQSLYQNGVECIEIDCSFANYYYDDETLALDSSGIDTPIQCFKKYDIVIPYVFRHGVEQPYSVDEQGNAKKFTIIGIKYSYTGLLRQKLYLQEVTASF